ncbi:hypothetical protein Goshw_022038 [Gossypium schwendimanii]|uniref:Protein kinase domain-containing protein n=1 Tax=Gossypium schwendimanii TaxID=34291 RepID=A0A7J9M802_GOSSC|nr:hypothetical protein [Gossypium schwendimanii]
MHPGPTLDKFLSELILDLMRKKRKGSETDASPEVTNKFASACDYIRSHFSLEDFSRIKKRCKEDVDTPPVGSCKSRLAGIATGPPCGASSLVPLGRGLKRKMGCIEVITRISGTKKVEDDYVKGDTIEQGKFRSIWLCRSRTSGVEFACKTLLRGEETVHREMEIMQHLSGHPGFVTLQVLYEEPDCFYLVLSGLAGSLVYVAPEVLLGNYSEKVDILSAGVPLHVLLVGVLPFQGDSLRAVFEAIKNVPQQVLTSLSSCCKSEEQDKNGVVDLLAVAISHVRISESKRSRICSPNRPIEQQCSPNLTVNNLCRAF